MKKTMMILISVLMMSNLFAADKPIYFLAAEQEVIKILEAPETASLVSEQIIEKKGSWYIIYLVIDAQNSYGAYLRSGFLSCVKILKTGRYNTVESGTQSTDREEITKDFLSLYKITIDWNTLN